MASTRRKNLQPSRNKYSIRKWSKDHQTSTKRALILDWLIKTKIDVASVVIQHTLNGSSVQQKNFSARHAINLVSTQAFVSRKTKQKQANHKHRKSTVHQLKAGTIHACDSNEEADSSDDSFCLQLKVHHVQAHNKMTQRPACLITNLAYRLKQHENMNLYLRARLDTCADVNIMSASVYKLVFRDPNIHK